MKRSLGNLERQLFAYAQMRSLSVLRSGELTGPLGISGKQERELLTRLRKAGMIAKVRRGLYLVPPRLPLGARWSPDEALALQTLMDDRQGRYQICGPNAFNYYGFDEQIPTRVYAYNNRFSGERTVGVLVLSLIKVADRRLGDTEDIPVTEGRAALYSSRVRTLVDAVYDWSRFNSLPRGFSWIRAELASGRVSAKDLTVCALRYGDVGTIRRIGALMDREGVGPKLLRQLERNLRPTTSFIPWIPSLSKRGTTDRRWGIVWNDREFSTTHPTA
jgi:predicted transcriptional regulator of viral defense system